MSLMLEPGRGIPLKALTWSCPPLDPATHLQWTWQSWPAGNLHWTWQGWLVQEDCCSLESDARRRLLAMH